MLETNSPETKQPGKSLVAEIRSSGLSPELARDGLEAVDQQFASVCQYRAKQSKVEVAKRADSGELARRAVDFHQREANRLHGLAAADDRWVKRLGRRPDEDSRRLAMQAEDGWASGQALWENLCQVRAGRYHRLAVIHHNRAGWLQHLAEQGPDDLDPDPAAELEVASDPGADSSGGFVGSVDRHRQAAAEQNNSYLRHWRLWQVEQSPGDELRSDDYYREIINTCWDWADHYCRLAEKNPDDADYYRELIAENEHWAEHWLQWLATPFEEKIDGQGWSDQNRRLVDRACQLAEDYGARGDRYDLLAAESRAKPVEVQSQPQTGIDDRLGLVREKLARQRACPLKRQALDSGRRERDCRRRSLGQQAKADEYQIEAEVMRLKAMADQEQIGRYQGWSDQGPAESDQDYRTWLQSTAADRQSEVAELKETIDFCRGQIKAGRQPERFKSILEDHQARLDRYLASNHGLEDQAGPEAWADYCRFRIQAYSQSAEDKLLQAEESRKKAGLRQNEAASLQLKADEIRQSTESLQHQIDNDDWIPDDEVALQSWLELRDNLAMASRTAAGWHQARADDWRSRISGTSQPTAEEGQSGVVDWAGRADYWANPESMPQAA